MKLKHHFTSLAILILSQTGWCSDTGTTGADFLNLGIGPRAVSMGDAQTGLANDVYATFFNPAGLSQLKGQEVGLTDNEYVQGISQQYAAYALPCGSAGTFGLSVNYLGIGGFQGYDASGSPTGNVKASDMAIGLSYSRPLYYDPRTNATLSAGLTGKWIEERLDTVSAKAYAGDAGFFFSPGLLWGEILDGFGAGLAIRNLGSSLKFDQESFGLPRVITAGTSYTGHLWGESLTLALDGRDPQAGSKSMGIGLEIQTLQNVIIRGGYTTEGDLGSGLRFGAGLRFKTIEIDYAYASEGDFGPTQRFGITLKFAETSRNKLNEAEQSYEKALHDYKRGRYTQALAELNRALELDPKHPQAMALMRKIYEQIKVIAPDQ
jgi:tetratricopeptide (TPR) repeat protein